MSDNKPPAVLPTNLKEKIMDTLGKMFDDGYRKNAVACKCKDWPRLQGMLAEHHENCIHHNLRKDAITQITNLVRGIEAWAADADGVHPSCWSAYRRAKLSIGEIVKEVES